MKKEEARRSLFNTEVYVDGKSKEIQEKLFELGFKWYFGKEVGYTDKPFLYINENGTLSYGDDMKFFKNDKAHEISVDYILNLEWDEDKNTKEEYKEMVKIIEDIRGHYATIIMNKVIVDEASKSIKETESFINEANRLLYQMKKDTTDYEGNKRFFERVKNAYNKYSIKKTTSDLNTFDRCLVCSGKGCVWVPEIYGYKSDDGKHHLIGNSVSSDHVIPYDESLKGKPYKEEDEK